MATISILFFLTLGLILLFLLYKTGQLRQGTLPLHKAHEFGDKDSWLKAHARSFGKELIRMSHELFYEFLVWFFKSWMRVNRKMYGVLKRRFPDIAYLIGERPNLKGTDEAPPASAFISDIKEHYETIKAEGKIEEPVNNSHLRKEE